SNGTTAATTTTSNSNDRSNNDSGIMNGSSSSRHDGNGVLDSDNDADEEDDLDAVILAGAVSRIEGDLAYDERADTVLDRIRSRDNGSYVYEPRRPTLSRVYEGLVPHTITDQ